MSESKEIGGDDSNIGRWLSKEDPASGRTYYYNDKTLKVTWDKPMSLMSSEEKETHIRTTIERREFFEDMERNIKRRLTHREESKCGDDEDTSFRSKPSNPLMRSVADMELIADSPDRESSSSSGSGHSSGFVRPSGRTRTISTIDFEMIQYLKNSGDSINKSDPGAKDDGAGWLPEYSSQNGVRQSRSRDNSIDLPGGMGGRNGLVRGSQDSFEAFLDPNGRRSRTGSFANPRSRNSSFDEKSWNPVPAQNTRFIAGSLGSERSDISGTSGDTSSNAEAKSPSYTDTDGRIRMPSGEHKSGQEPQRRPSLRRVNSAGSAGSFEWLRETDYLNSGRGLGVSAGGAAETTDTATFPAGAAGGKSAFSQPIKIGGIAATAIISKPPQLRRRNSTSTIFVNSTMSFQDNDATIKCVSVVIRAHMRSCARGQKAASHKHDIFMDAEYRESGGGGTGLQSQSKTIYEDEGPQSKSPFEGYSLDAYGAALSPRSPRSELSTSPRLPRLPKYEGPRLTIPTVDEIEDFFNNIFVKSELEGECIIMALIYCERLVKATGGELDIRYDNWRSILFACLVMSSKVWDDLSMWNVDFSNICPSFDLDRINELELSMLNILRYKIKVSASEYAKYYFHLRSMMARLGLARDGHSEPLDLLGARKLQLASEKVAEKGFAGVNKAGRPNLANTIGPGLVPAAAAMAGRSRARSSITGIPPMVSRAISNDHNHGVIVGSVGTSVHNFMGIDELMNPKHTNADGTDRVEAMQNKADKMKQSVPFPTSPNKNSKK